MRKFILTILTFGTIALAAIPASAQSAEGSRTRDKQKAAQNSAIDPQSTTCSFTFRSGTGLSSINYCVTANGNLAKLEIPKGTPMVSRANHGEGYGFCDQDAQVAYSDFGGLGDSGNWKTAKVVNRGPNFVKIARTTSDGLWTLTQTVTRTDGNLPSAKVVMALTNNSTVAKEVTLLRDADMDAAGISINTFDATNNSAMAWNSVSLDPSTAHGVVLQALGAEPFLTFAYAQDTALPPDPCDPLAHMVQTMEQNIDGSVVMFYEDTVNPHATMNATAAYRGR